MPLRSPIPVSILNGKERPMKIVVIIVRLLLGLVFAFFGANLMFHFLPNPPIPPGPLKDFTDVMFTTHYIVVVGFFQFVSGVLLLINRFVPLALAMLAPMLVNILTTHLLVQHGGVFPIPILVTLMWFFLFWRLRSSYTGVFDARGAA
jgi:putative oxidoreductase